MPRRLRRSVDPGGPSSSCTIGIWSTGAHYFVITATDRKGVTSNYQGTFTVQASAADAADDLRRGGRRGRQAEKRHHLNRTNNSRSGGRRRIRRTLPRRASRSTAAPSQPISGPNKTSGYSCAIGAWSAGTHTYSITATDKKGISSTVVGTFDVTAATRRGGDDRQRSRGRGLAADQRHSGIGRDAHHRRGPRQAPPKLASQTVTIDGRAVTPVKGPSGGLYSCAIGAWSAGTHAYVITATNSKGFSFNSSGTFTVAADLMVDASTSPQGSAGVLSSAATRSDRRRSYPTVGIAIRQPSRNGHGRRDTSRWRICRRACWARRWATRFGSTTTPQATVGLSIQRLPTIRSLSICSVPAHWPRGAGTSAAARVDLLTAVMHEMGHVLGNNDTSSDGLMDGILPLGVRRAAAVDEVFAALHQA